MLPMQLLSSNQVAWASGWQRQQSALNSIQNNYWHALVACFLFVFITLEPAGGRYLRAFYMLFQVAEPNLEYWESDDYDKKEKHF